MLNKTFVRILWLAAIVLTGLPNKGISQVWNPNYSIGTSTNKYDFSYNQTPDPIVELYPPGYPNTGFTYSWESSLTPVAAGFTPTGVSSSSYTFSQPLGQTMYYRRKSTNSSSISVYSNIVKISVVSVNWEDINYVREHNVMTTAITSWQAVDQLAIGPKLQTTTYMDGLGRSVEKVSREMATPAQSGNLWGDMVQFAQYDSMGREPISYLPYTTTTQSGKFKTTQLTEQPQYYSNPATYNETSAYSSISFDNSPLNRIFNIKEPGAAWAGSIGNAVTYDMNSAADNVQIFSVDYVQGDAPIDNGAYAPNSLYKLTYTDVNNKQVVEYTDKAGRLILKKIQIDAIPSAAHSGWICTYNVYDDFGLLRYQIQPEGVKYLDANGWSFTGVNGPTVLAEQCFQYVYDDKGHTIWKKAPGAMPLNILYDIRDRPVFTQDGNQASLPTPQWAANLYDDLDRPVITALYNTTETIASLKNDIAAATTVTSISSTNPGQPVKDLVVTVRQPGVTQYTAQNSITFSSEGSGSFQSGPGDAFVAQISSTASSSGYTVTSTVLGNPITAANMANPGVTTVLKYLFYDNYSFSTAKAFDNNFTNGSAYSNADPNVLPITPSARTLNMPTGELTGVLGTTIFLGSTNYFDEKSRNIQTLEDNIKSGTDVNTYQYHFDGHVLSTCAIHSAPGTDYSSFTILTKYVFDKLDRMLSLQKQFGSNPLKTVASYDYDDQGRVITRHLDPGYNNKNSGGPDLESLNYTFNIHNQITGINRDYALKTPATYNKWGHFFGMDLGYDKLDNVFNTPQLDGQVGGQLWNTQGDDAQRKYDYTYDNANRLINAQYNEQQHPSDGWSNGKMDFSVSGTSGQITYDNNGNLLTMLQKGVSPGTPAPVVVDDLRYVYNTNSNKLLSVTDQMPVASLNGQFGDFKDGTNAAGTPDYVFDNNGNLIVDLNKNVQSLNNGNPGAKGINYNYLDKPDQIRIVGKGTIKIVYSADGEKLQRVYIPESGASSTITSYINQYLYQETATLTTSSPAPFSGTGVGLAYINFEEGRVRVMTPSSQTNGYDGLTESGDISLPNGKEGVWDYFITDYLQNIRMVLTEEIHQAVNTCTMETTNNRPAAEDPVFGQPGAGNEVETTRYPTPAGWAAVNSSSFVSRLGNIAGHNIGPNTLQKVMAGDSVSATAQYYYQGPETSSNPNIISNILSSLTGALGGNATAGTLVHGNAPAITSQLSGSSGFINAVQPTGVGGTTPQAFLTILFFDERFNFIAAADGGVAQQQVASSWTTGTPPLGLINVKAPKNGYAFIYVSNRSDQDVYFDNLVVGINSGNIIEENHYYAFGLRIAGISSHKLGDANEGKLSNPYQFNDKEMLDEDGGLNWYDYGFRNYDPQIGRFTQLDPLADDYPFYTPYQFAGNDPIANVDMDGLEPFSAIGTAQMFSGNFILFGQGVGETANLVDKGTEGAHWVTTMEDAVVHFQPALKAGASALKPILTGTINISITAMTAVDHVAVARPSPIQDATTEQRIKLSLVIHDQMEPDHPLIGGIHASGADVLIKNAKGDGYSWAWRPQAIQEDNGFWLAWMPLPKGLGLLKGAARETEVIEDGVYEIGVSGSKYIGMSKNVISRVLSHFAKGGKFYQKKLESEIYHAMPGSSPLEREVYEQYRIEKYGIKNLRNIRNPMGGRMDIYKKMIDKVIKEYKLPR